MDFLEIWYRRHYENLSQIQIWLKSTENIEHFTGRSNFVLLLPTTLNRHKCAVLEWNCIRLLRYPSRYKHYANAPQCNVLHALPVLFYICIYIYVCVCVYIYIYIYTGCNRRNGPDFGRVFLRSNYTDITQNTYIQSSIVKEILAREVWNIDSYYSLIDYQIHIETGRNMWFL